MSFSIRVLGTGDAFTRNRWNSSLVLEAEGTRVLLDAPPCLARALAGLGLSLDDVDHVLLTHYHGDHVGGLEQLLFWRRFVTRRRVTLHAIPEVLAGLWDGRLKGGMDRLLDAQGQSHAVKLEEYADLSPLGPGTTRIGALEVEWRPTVHHVPTSAFRLRAGGRTFGHSADTSFDRSLVDWLGESDLFFHETGPGIHTPLAALVALPDALKARMRLTHYADEHDVERSPIRCAREGERLEIQR